MKRSPLFNIILVTLITCAPLDMRAMAMTAAQPVAGLLPGWASAIVSAGAHLVDRVDPEFLNRLPSAILTPAAITLAVFCGGLYAHEKYKNAITNQQVKKLDTDFTKFRRKTRERLNKIEEQATSNHRENVHEHEGTRAAVEEKLTSLRKKLKTLIKKNTALTREDIAQLQSTTSAGFAQLKEELDQQNKTTQESLQTIERELQEILTIVSPAQEQDQTAVERAINPAGTKKPSQGRHKRTHAGGGIASPLLSEAHKKPNFIRRPFIVAPYPIPGVNVSTGS